MNLPQPKYTVTDVNHKYTILLPDGQTIGPLKSVTGVLGIIAKPALIPWASREAANYFKTEILRLGKRALDVATLEQIAKDAAQVLRVKHFETLSPRFFFALRAAWLGCIPSVSAASAA